MVIYKVIKESISSIELGNYTAFGIVVYNETQDSTQEIAHISDVFLNKADAINFVNRCNRLGLELVHLPLVIEDALIQNNNF